MIVYHQGKGFLALVIPVLLLVLVCVLWGLKELPPTWAIGLILLGSGVLLWWWGRRLNRPLDELAEMQMKTLGEIADPELEGRHSLYGIRMEHWGVFYTIVGPGLCIYDLVFNRWLPKAF